MRTHRTIPFLLALAAGASAAAAADFETCWAALEGKRWGEAVPCFQQVVAENPEWSWGHAYLGGAYQGQGKLDEALAEFQKAMDLMTPDDGGVEPFYNAAQVLMTKKQHSAAMDALKRGEPFVKPEDQPNYLALRARVQTQLGKHAAAVADFKKSGKKDFDTLLAMGRAAYAGEDFATATDALESALKASPGEATASRFLSLAYFRRAEGTTDDETRAHLYAKAAEVASAMLAKDAKSSEAHNLVGRALLGAGKLDEAERHFLEVLKLKPDHCFAKANLGQLALARKQWDVAVDMSSKALACLDRDAQRDVHLNLGFAHAGKAKDLAASAGDTDAKTRQDAIALYQKAKEQFQAADAIRSSSATKGQVAAMDEAIAGLRENIETIQANLDAEAANEQAEEEERKAREKQEAVEKALKGKTSG